MTRQDRMRMRGCWPFLVLTFALSVGCAPGLDGTIDGQELGPWEDFVFYEFRGVDAGSALPVHPLHLWMLPFAGGCEEVGIWQTELAVLRAGFEGGDTPEDYCAGWEAAMTARLGTEGAWVANFRMEAEPMPENETPERDYPFHDEVATDLASEPAFDATLVHYPAPSYEACAAEFTESDAYAPERVEAQGGTVSVKTWVADDRLAGTLVAEFPGAGESGLEGRFDATFCPAAGAWPLDMSTLPE
jgi:hypothetical protein